MAAAIGRVTLGGMGCAMENLLKAFHDDHAVLGRGFHRISTCLRAGDLAGAQSAAAALDQDAGAHIAFEEQHFYPALVPLLGADHVRELHEEHAEGLDVVRALRSPSTDPTLAAGRRLDLLRASESMEKHIAECGELFEAMGRIAEREQAALFDELLRLRAEHPAWTAYADSRH